MYEKSFAIVDVFIDVNARMLSPRIRINSRTDVQTDVGNKILAMGKRNNFTSASSPSQHLKFEEYN